MVYLSLLTSCPSVLVKTSFSHVLEYDRMLNGWKVINTRVETTLTVKKKPLVLVLPYPGSISLQTRTKLKK